MDVNKLNPNGPERRPPEADGRTAAAGSAPAAETARGPDAAARSAEDAVSLSPQAQQLGQLQARVSEHEAFDQARVEEIRAAIAEGRYHVDPERLAERFLALEIQIDQ